ncbi:MAG TPA: XylR N-terminal domain-containing protein [Polyangiaceae bacterium]|jgi:son of sevenless-like protein|nr:XylR N-terminal domain-containing protein [Polyangiaceae bacterium]
MLNSARVPEPFFGTFELAEVIVRKHFGDLQMRPAAGTVHVGGERYVLLRAESLYLAWFDALISAFGEDAAMTFIYSTAREIGRNDAKAFADKLGLTDGVARLATGPLHFAHAGWAYVYIFDDSMPAKDENYFLHYSHPNTFETEVLQAQKLRTTRCACLFSAGYSAGWCAEAFAVDVHSREIRCLAKGDSVCEFIMGVQEKLDEHEARLRSTTP